MNNASSDSRAYVRKILFAAATVLILAVFLYLLFRLFHILLWIFAGILLAVLLDGLSSFLKKKTGLAHQAALLVVVVLITALFVLVFWLAGPRIIEQFTLLGQRAPEAINSIKSYLEKYAWGKQLISTFSKPGQILPMGSHILGGITGVFSTLFGFLTGVVIVLFVGIYAAASPGLYLDNFLRLVPGPRRARVQEVIKSLGTALRWWLAGRFISMVIVGILTVIGLSLAGIPLVLLLGFIAALLAFVPYIGAYLSGIPAGLIALAESPRKLLYVFLVYLSVHLLEGYVITPLVQKRAVSLPPALLLSMQIVMGVLAGLVGIFLATPLVVTIIVLVQMLYVQDVLGEKCKLLGSHRSKGSK
jgi:predicted PurR-regulated permease PerM